MAYMYGEQNEQENLIIKYLPLVRRTVSRIDPGYSYDLDDLINIGVIGLMDAIKRYDKDKNVPFEAYASLRIRGAVFDELRKAGPVSRERMNKLNQYYEAKESLESANFETPDEIDIVKKMGIDEKELAKIHDTIHTLSNISFDSTVFSSEGKDIQLRDVVEDEDAISPEDIFLEGERKLTLKKSIDKLNEREQILLNLYYVEELTLKEIAYILDISTPRVSQIHGKTLLKLRTMIEKEY